MNILPLLLVLLTLGGCAGAGGGTEIAQPSTPGLGPAAQAPDLPVGAWFEFEGTAGPWVGRRVLRSASAEGYIFDTPLGELKLTRELNLVRVDKFEADPFVPDLQFPLVTGREWTVGFTFRVAGSSAYYRGKGRVLGLEEIRTRAGAFQTYKVGGEAVGQGWYRWTCWYAPSVGQIVKCQSPDIPDRNFELVRWHGKP